MEQLHKYLKIFILTNMNTVVHPFLLENVLFGQENIILI